MGVKKMAKELIPTCNFCQNKAYVDTPTFSGAWAYACKDHMSQISSPALREMGTTFEAVKTTAKNRGKKVKRAHARIDCDIEEAMMDSVITVACPECGMEIQLQQDFNGHFTCEGCEQPLFADPYEDLCRGMGGL